MTAVAGGLSRGVYSVVEKIHPGSAPIFEAVNLTYSQFIEGKELFVVMLGFFFGMRALAVKLYLDLGLKDYPKNI